MELLSVALPLRMNRPGRDDGHSPSSSAEVNASIATPSANPSLRMVFQGVKTGIKPNMWVKRTGREADRSPTSSA
jgi:hypothetical protein